MGCSDDEERMDIGSPVEIYGIRMYVTNNAGEDLVLNSDKYYRTVKKFRFDTWEIYLDGSLIQTGDNGNKYFEREVNYQQETESEKKNVRLSSNLEIQNRIDNYAEKHVAEYVVSSASLFGDTEKHTIRMELWKIENEYGYYARTKCNISVDDVEQEVFYPYEEQPA